MTGRTVRDATFDVLRRHGLTSLFANPGSTEISLLADLPGDLHFVLGLHEGSVVGMATGFAIARGEPALAILHTTAGLGNAIGALATARVNRAPLVVLVGQQDRRHLAQEPFLAGKLHGLAGEYPVWVNQPVRPQDVPGAISRAYHEAATGQGPALVIVPMDDWDAVAGEEHEVAAPSRVVRAMTADSGAVAELAEMVDRAESPVLVVGAGADDPDTWTALVQLAERLSCPVWQEPFSARAGFPQDHPLFAGHLPAARTRLREVLAPYDFVLAVGAPVFRQYPYQQGPLVEEGTRVAMITQDPAEAHRSPVELAILAPPAAACAALAGIVTARNGSETVLFVRPSSPEPPAAGEPLRAGHVIAAIAARIPRDAVVIEESPSSRPELLTRIVIRESLGFLSPAMGGLGFTLPAAIGMRLAQPDRPVVAMVGDGSSLYAIQSLWSAAHYRAGALFIVFKNGGYAVMDRLVEMHGGAGPWPSFDVDITAIAQGFGCPARRISGYEELLATLDDVLPGLAGRDEPLLLEIVIAPDETFDP